MKISTKMGLINLIFMVNIALLSCLSVFQLFTLNKVYKESKLISSALRDQVEADMMHDGLRADVLYALKVAQENDETKRKEAIEGTQEHVENFKRLINEVEKMNVSPKVNETLSTLKEPLDRYINSAIAITNDAFTQADGVNEKYDSFEKDFEYLEGALEKFSTVIDNEFQRVNKTVVKTQTITTYMIGFNILLSLIIATAAWISSRRNITYPITSMAHAMRLLAADKLETKIPYLEKNDEIGEIASALEVFKTNRGNAIRLEEAEKAEQTKREQRQRKMEGLISEFDSKATQTVATVASASSQLSQTAEHMSKLATDTNHQSTEVAMASQQASHNVQSVASAAEQMATTVQEISKQITLSNEVVRDAMNKAQIANNSSEELVEMSKSVGAIASLIENITGQINLLALNATIESARSGEAGKGFAVVANEVKNLATQTAKATDQIRQQLEAVQTTAGNVASSLGEVRVAIAKVNEGSAAIAAAVEEQSAATQEIVNNMSTATQGVEQINHGIFSIKGGTDSTTNATQQVLDAAKLLSFQAEQMDQEVKTFLRDILAA